MAVHPGPSPEEDFGLDAVAQHNADFSHSLDDAKGLGIYHDGYRPAYQEETQYVQNPPTPRSNTDEGVRTRSGRSVRRTESPFSSGKSRTKSPANRAKKDRKSKIDKTKTPKLTAPLSVLTKDMKVPLRDMEAWVNRPAAERRQEVEKRNGYVTRPMNSFMLYRSAYAERTKQWCLQNNHQVVSSVSGESWPMEPQEVRDKFNEWAKIERTNHQAAHPEYKFSPSKTPAKRRKGEFSDEEEPSDLDDPDAEYRGPRGSNKRLALPRENPYAFGDTAITAGQHPYFASQAGYGAPDFRQSISHPLPSNIAFDDYGRPYNPQTRQYLHTPSHGYSQSFDSHTGAGVSTPASMNGAQTLGGFGMPGSNHGDDLFGSRSATPLANGVDAYGRPVFYQPTFQQPAGYHQQIMPTTSYEHPQYLQTQTLPAHSLDPQLEAVFADVNAAAAAAAAAAAQGHESHFENAFGDGGGGIVGLQEYYDQHTSPNSTLAPQWSPTEVLKRF